MENNGNTPVQLENQTKRSGNGLGIAIASMVLGIVSIVGVGGNAVGIASAIVGIFLSRKAVKLGDESSFALAGKITSFVGLGVRAASIVATFIYVVIFVIYYVFVVMIAVIAAFSETMYYDSFYYAFESFTEVLSAVVL